MNENEIIIICDGSNSGDVFLGFKGILASTIGKIKHNEEIDTNYLFLFLKSNFKELNTQKRGGAISHLDNRIFNSLEIPLPPLSEQKKIVAYLDDLREKIERLKQLQQKQLEELDELKKIYFGKSLPRRIGKILTGQKSNFLSYITNTLAPFIFLFRMSFRASFAFSKG